MNKKQTIKTLSNFNEWRRGRYSGTIDQNEVGIAIDNAITTIESSKSYMEYQNSYAKKYNEYQMLFDACVGDLQFSNIQIEALYGALDEIVSMTNDPLAKKVAEMTKERHQTDKLIHSRLIFGNK